MNNYLHCPPSYLNDPLLKAKYTERMRRHMAADELIRGTGYKNGRGCAVGCTLNEYEHASFETELGIPAELAHLLDTLHEETSDEIWPTYALRFLEAIPVGADLLPVVSRINIFIQQQNIRRVEGIRNISEPLRDQVVSAIKQVVEALPTESAAEAAEAAEAAWSAADSAWSAAEADSARSAWSAARSAARSARSARSAFYDDVATELLRLLKAAR